MVMGILLAEAWLTELFAGTLGQVPLELRDPGWLHQQSFGLNSQARERSPPPAGFGGLRELLPVRGGWRRVAVRSPIQCRLASPRFLSQP